MWRSVRPLLIGVLPLVFFWRQTLGRLTLGDQDAVFWFFPAYRFFAERVKSGRLPIWNPDYYCGVPLFAQWQSGMLDPLNWVHLAGATSRTLTLSLELGFALALLGMYWFMRTVGIGERGALVAAIVYGLSGFAVARTLYPGLLHIHALTPVVLTMTERLCRRRRLRDVVAGGLVVAWQVFAAHPQPLIYSSLLVVAWALFRVFAGGREATAGERWRLLFKIGAMFVLGAALAAVQLLPAAETAGRSVRQDWPYELFTRHSIHPVSLLTAIIPFFNGSGSAGSGSLYRMAYWGDSWHHNESQIYVGVVVLALAISGAVAAVKSRYGPGIFWSIVALVGTALVMGRYAAPLAQLLYHVPMLNRFRSPNRHWMEVVLALGFLAGYAVDRLENGAERLLAVVVGRVACLLALLTVIVGGLILGWRQPAEGWLRSLTGWSHLPAGFLDAAGAEFLLPMVVAALSCVALLIWLRPQNRRRAFALLPLLLLADYQLYAIFAPISHPPAVERLLGSGMPVEVAREALSAPPFRSHVMLTPAQGEFSPLLFHGHEMIGGYDPLLDERYKSFSGIEEAGRTYLRSIFDPTDRTLDLLNTRFVLIPPGLAPPPSPPSAGAGESDRSTRWRETDWRSPSPAYAGFRVFENLSALPRAWLVTRVEPAWEGDQLKLIRGEKSDSAGRPFDPRLTALVDMPAGADADWYAPFLGNDETPPPASGVTLTRRVDDRLTLRTSADRPTILVLSETAVPGWVATVDGREVPWHRVNFILRGLPLTPGSHLVEFVYRPASIKIGAAISLIAALVVIALLLRRLPATLYRCFRGSAS